MANIDLDRREHENCTTCGNEMLFMTANPCPVNRQMDKCTYFCCTCSRLKTFALQRSAEKRPLVVSVLQTIEYRFYELDCNGHICRPAWKFQFRDDLHAEKHAKRIIEDQDIEIWCGARLVSTIRSEHSVRRTPSLVS